MKTDWTLKVYNEHWNNKNNRVLKNYLKILSTYFIKILKIKISEIKMGQIININTFFLNILMYTLILQNFTLFIRN